MQIHRQGPTHASIEGVAVIDQHGKLFLNKLVQSVPSTSQDANLRRFARGGSQATSERHRISVLSHAQRLLHKITLGGTHNGSLEFLGADFKRNAQLAKLKTKEALLNFENLVPEKL